MPLSDESSEVNYGASHSQTGKLVLEQINR